MKIHLKSILIVFMLMQVVHVTFMWVWLTRFNENQNRIVRVLTGEK